MIFKFVLKPILFITVCFFCSCANLYRENYRENLEIIDYNPEVFSKSETNDAQIIRTNNVELESIGLIENDYLNIGYSYFEGDEINARKQILEFAKEIGAEVVLHKTSYREGNFGAPQSSLSPVTNYAPSPVYGNVVGVNNFPIYNSSPGFDYQVAFDDEKGKLEERVTATDPFGSTLQTEYKDGKIVRQQLSTSFAQQAWAIPYDQRNFYALPYGGEFSHIIPMVPVELGTFSYYASFWVKSKHPPALGVDVANLTDDIKKSVNILNGVSVWAVSKNSPASRVPIYRGDILIAINDIPIISFRQMGDLIRDNVGKKIELKIIRNRELITREVRLNDKSF